MQQRGFQLEHCRPNCPKAARDWHKLYDDLNTKLTELNLQQILQDRFHPVRNHHLPKVCLAGCPNGCSQPNIKDFGISGYVTPKITAVPCTECDACVHSCLEEALIRVPKGIIIDKSRCISCGDCLEVCPSGTLTFGESGWKLLLGGRVGRHPKFAESVGQVITDQEVVDWISAALIRYLEEAEPQERLTCFLERAKNLPKSSLNSA